MPYLCAVVDALSQHQPSLRGISAPGRLCRRSYAIARGDSAASQSGAPVSRLQCWPHLPFNVLSLPSCHGTGCNGGVRCFHQRLLLVQRQLTPSHPMFLPFPHDSARSLLFSKAWARRYLHAVNRIYESVVLCVLRAFGTFTFLESIATCRRASELHATYQYFSFGNSTSRPLQHTRKHSQQ